MGYKNNTGDTRDLEEFNKQVQNSIEQRQQDRQTGIEEINKHLAQKPQREYSMPRADYNGFSEHQMKMMCEHPLEEGCAVQLRHLTEEEISLIPIMRQALYLMNALSEKEIRLTKKGSLPMKMVSELYSLGHHDMTLGLFPQMTEECNPDIQALRRILRETGLVKTQAGKLTLTIKGRKYLTGNHNEMLRSIILYLFTKYNTGWYDRQKCYEIGNQGRLYSLWLLHHFGTQWRLMDFYKEEYFKAFPSLLRQDDLQQSQIKPSKFYTYRAYRVFQNLFAIIGVCEINESLRFSWTNWGAEVRKTPILDMMFSFEEPEKI